MNRIISLEYLRGVAALMVLYGHVVVVGTTDIFTPKLFLPFLTGAPLDFRTMSVEPGTLLLPVDDDKMPKTVTVGFWGQLGPNMGFEKFSFRIAGDPPVELTVSHGDNHKESVINIGAGALVRAATKGYLQIDAWAPDGKNGRQLGLANDERVFGSV